MKYLWFVSLLCCSLWSLAQEPQYAGLDKDLSGITIRMATIGGGQYKAMYDAIKMFEEKTGAKRIGLVNNPFALGLVYVAINIPF